MRERQEAASWKATQPSATDHAEQRIDRQAEASAKIVNEEDATIVIVNGADVTDGIKVNAIAAGPRQW